MRAHYWPESKVFGVKTAFSLDCWIGSVGCLRVDTALVPPKKSVRCGLSAILENLNETHRQFDAQEG